MQFTQMVEMADSSLPHGISIVSNATNAMEGYELGLHLRLYLHPAGLKADYLASSHDG